MFISSVISVAYCLPGAKGAGRIRFTRREGEHGVVYFMVVENKMIISSVSFVISVRIPVAGAPEAPAILMRFTRREGEHGDYFCNSKMMAENKMIISSVSFVCSVRILFAGRQRRRSP